MQNEIIYRDGGTAPRICHRSDPRHLSLDTENEKGEVHDILMFRIVTSGTYARFHHYEIYPNASPSARPSPTLLSIVEA